MRTTLLLTIMRKAQLGVFSRLALMTTLMVVLMAMAVGIRGGDDDSAGGDDSGGHDKRHAHHTPHHADGAEHATDHTERQPCRWSRASQRCPA